MALSLACPGIANGDEIDVGFGPFRLEAKLSHQYSSKMAWSPDSRLLATANPENVRIWENGKWASPREVPIVNLIVAPDIVFSGDGKSFATVHAFVPAHHNDSAFGIIDLQSHKTLTFVPSPTTKLNPYLFGRASSLSSYPACDLVAATYEDSRFYDVPISLFNKTDWSKAAIELPTWPRPHLIAFSADCSAMATFHYPWRKERSGPLNPQESKIYRLSDGDVVQRIKPDIPRYVNAAALSHDGRLLAVSSGGFPMVSGNAPLTPTGESVHLYDAQSGQRTRVLDGIFSGARPLSFSPDGNWLAAVLPEIRSVKVAIWDASTWQRIQTITWSCDGITGSLEFSPDARLLAAQCYPKNKGLLDLVTNHGATTTIVLRAPR